MWYKKKVVPLQPFLQKMKRKVIIVSMLLFAALSANAQSGTWQTSGTTNKANNSVTLGISSELAEKSTRTRYWFYDGPVISSGISFNKTRRNCPSGYYGAGRAYSVSVPTITFKRSSHQASAAHSTYTTTTSQSNSGHTLGLTTAVSSDLLKKHSTQTYFHSTGSMNVSSGRGEASRASESVAARKVGDMNTSTTNDEEDEETTRFKPDEFNNAVPKDGAGPVGDAIIPMLLLMGFVVAYKIYKKN